MGNIEGQEKDFLEAGITALGIIVATLGSTVGMLLGTAFTQHPVLFYLSKILCGNYRNLYFIPALLSSPFLQIDK